MLESNHHVVGENTLRNVEFEHVYFAELQVRKVRLSVGSRNYCKCSHALIQ